MSAIVEHNYLMNLWYINTGLLEYKYMHSFMHILCIRVSKFVSMCVYIYIYKYL